VRIPLYQIDAFTGRVFAGNPAAVCPLEEWLDAATMQAIAAENNLSETAFFVRGGEGYGLRWFTPTLEVDLCGHATLASAFVVFEFLDRAAEAVRFETQSGELVVRRKEGLLAMDFPGPPPPPPGPPGGPPARTLRPGCGPGGGAGQGSARVVAIAGLPGRL
jgi:PhzF family phenazine biosynthesis protein